jgi:hypothetical protein
VYGISAGAAGAFLFSFAGPAEFWQALAFAVVGAALGSGIHTPAFRRAHAVLGSEGDGGGWLTLFGMREWALEDGSAVPLFSAHGASAAAVVRCESGRCQLIPAGGGPVHVAGAFLQGPRRLHDAEVVELDGMSLRFREIRA